MNTVTPEAEQDKAYEELQSVKGFVFDMDGVIYLGTRLLPGVNDLFNTLRLRGFPFILGTNNSTATQAEFVTRLKTMGVEVDAEQIQTSVTVTRAMLLKDETVPKDAMILTIGEPSIAAILQEGTSLRFATDDTPTSEIDIVVAGLDFDLTYATIERATDAIQNGAKFFATNADDRLPTESGYKPGAGACIAPITVASRVEPTIIGKPQPHMMIMAAEEMGLAPDEVIMIGDRLDTDILAAQRACLKTALVLTGLTTREMVAEADILPDFVFPDLPALLQAFTGHA